jgi:hypothetical protein
LSISLGRKEEGERGRNVPSGLNKLINLFAKVNNTIGFLSMILSSAFAGKKPT